MQYDRSSARDSKRLQRSLGARSVVQQADELVLVLSKQIKGGETRGRVAFVIKAKFEFHSGASVIDPQQASTTGGVMAFATFG